MYKWKEYKSKLTPLQCASSQKARFVVCLSAFHVDAMLPLYKSLMEQKKKKKFTKQNKNKK